jgi:hypothetical protein
MSFLFPAEAMFAMYMYSDIIHPSYVPESFSPNPLYSQNSYHILLKGSMSPPTKTTIKCKLLGLVSQSYTLKARDLPGLIEFQ